MHYLSIPVYILALCGNPISSEAILTILQAMHANNTLQALYYPTPIKEKAKSLEEQSIIKITSKTFNFC